MFLDILSLMRFHLDEYFSGEWESKIDGFCDFYVLETMACSNLTSSCMECPLMGSTPDARALRQMESA